jgi:flagellar motor protein MotB
MDEYEQLLEIYQAENALGIARAAHADELAPNTFNKAQASYDEARRLMDVKAGVSLVVQSARAAAQTADDARMIAERHVQDDRVASAERQAEQAKAEAQQARADADAARAQADAARAQADTERTARQQAESQAAQAPSSSSQDLPIAPPPPSENSRPPIAYREQPDSGYSVQQQQARMRMLERLNGVTSTRDTPRGLVITIADSGFENGTLRSTASDTLARLAAVLMQPGVRVAVEGYSDSAAGGATSERRAQAVRDLLVSRGVDSSRVTVRNLADSRPLTSNAAPGGRIENRRVEIVISGEAVGSRPLWDRSYNVTLR